MSNIYYHVDVGFYPVPVKMCFTPKAFYKVLEDHGITAKPDMAPLELGIAETHSFSSVKEAVIVVVFSLAECIDNAALLASVVAHESTHVISRILDHIGEDVDDFGEETRAYLTDTSTTTPSNRVANRKLT